MVRKASTSDLEVIVPLFNAYRVFYGQEPDLEGAKTFLEERFANGENVIFLAFNDGEPSGFVQLYTTFSSVSMEPFYILNDLFVSPEFRKKGVGETLLNHAKTYCESQNYKGLALETATDNPAQQLYERLGWVKDQSYFHYFWKNTK